MTQKDDDGIDYEIILKNVLHFPGSPVKILSVAALADQLKDDWDTWILSRRTQSTFTWDSGKFCKTIFHGPSKIPEMLVNTSKDSIASFNALVSKSKSSDTHLAFQSVLPNERNQVAKDEDNYYSVLQTILFLYANHAKRIYFRFRNCPRRSPFKIQHHLSS